MFLAVSPSQVLTGSLLGRSTSGVENDGLTHFLDIEDVCLKDAGEISISVEDKSSFATLQVRKEGFVAQQPFDAASMLSSGCVFVIDLDIEVEVALAQFIGWQIKVDHSILIYLFRFI